MGLDEGNSPFHPAPDSVGGLASWLSLMLSPAPPPTHSTLSLLDSPWQFLEGAVPFIKTVHQLPECMAAHPASLPETLPNVDVATRSP